MSGRSEAVRIVVSFSAYSSLIRQLDGECPHMSRSPFRQVRLRRIRKYWHHTDNNSRARRNQSSSKTSRAAYIQVPVSETAYDKYVNYLPCCATVAVCVGQLFRRRRTSAALAKHFNRKRWLGSPGHYSRQVTEEAASILSCMQRYQVTT